MSERKPIKIVETVLRDGHQSLIATRMTTEQMLPIIRKNGSGRISCRRMRGEELLFDALPQIYLKEDPVGKD